MDSGSGKGISVPSKIMAGLAFMVLLGLGLCGLTAVVHNDTATSYFFAIGAFCFWGGLLLLIAFGIGWGIVALGKMMFGKKD